MRVRFSYDTFRGQTYGGVSRYITELHQGLLARHIDSRILAGLHRNALLSGLPGVLGMDVDGLRPMLARDGLTKLADRAFERLWAPGQTRDTLYHKTYFDIRVPSGPALAVTVYDMIHERYPEQFGPRDVTPAAKRPWCEAADVVFAISAQTRDDLLERFNLDADRVVVTPLGVRPVIPDPAVFPAGGRPFVLYVGSRSYRYKNFEGFARAFARSESRVETTLVCFGGGPLVHAERAMLAKLGLNDVAVVGGSDSALAAHYAKARALVYPSHYEGFGLPPLEAMSHDCPVAAASVAAITEVVADAAVLFDPDNLDDMASSIDLVVGDEGRRAALVAAGRQRVAAHPWSRTVDLTLAGYLQVPSGGTSAVDRRR